MGVIVRNGNAYGGFGKNFTTVNSLNEVENPEIERLYAVENNFYYYDGTKWVEVNPDTEKSINAATNMIVTGDGEGWACGSPFYVKAFKLPANYIWSKYSNSNINVIEGVGDMVAISRKSNTDNLNAPILGISGEAKVFFEDTTNIDVSGTTTIRMHGNSLIEMDSGHINNNKGPNIKFHGNPTFYFEDFAHLKLDDFAYVSIENSSFFHMSGKQSTNEGKGPFTGPSPYFSMTNATAFIMQSRENVGPALEIDENQFIFMGQGALPYTNVSTGYGGPSKPNLNLEFPLNMSSYIREEQPAFRIGKGAQIEFATNDNGSLKFKVCPNEGAFSYITIDPDSGSTLNLKISPKEGGLANYLLEGNDIFLKIDNNAHIENLNDSIFIMKSSIPMESDPYYTDNGESITFETSIYYNGFSMERFLNFDDGPRFLSEVKVKNHKMGGDPIYYSGGTVSSVPYYENMWETIIGGIQYSTKSFADYLSSSYSTPENFQASTTFQDFISSNFGEDAIGTVISYSFSPRNGRYWTTFSYTVENAEFKAYLYQQTPPLSENLSYNDLSEQNKAVVNASGRDLSNAYVKSFQLRSDMLYTTTIKNYRIATSHLGKTWQSLIDKNYQTSSPIFQMYNASNFIMKGRSLSHLSAEKASGSPLVEFSDDAEIRIGGGTKITTSYTGNHILTFNFTDTDNNISVSFTIEELQNLKALINE